jgi:hypothetical protein
MADVSKITHNYSDAYRFVRSKIVGSAADDGNRVFVIKMPRYSFLTDLFLKVITAYNSGSTGTVLVGYVLNDGDGTITEDVDGYFDDTEAASEVVGIKGITEGGVLEFPFGGSITVSFSKGNASADVEVQLLAEYCVIV